MMLIIKKIRDYLNQPYPYPQKRWLIVLIPTVWVFLIFFLLQPLSLFYAKNKFIIAFAFTLLTAVVSSIVVYIFPLIFRNFYSRDRWKNKTFYSVGIFITTIVASIGLIIWDMYTLEENINFIPDPLLRIVAWYLSVYLVGIIPTIILHSFMSKLYVGSKPRRIEKSVDDLLTAVYNNSVGKVTLCGGTKDVLVLSPQDMLYAEVFGNYVTIHYLEEDCFCKKLLRITLQQVIDAFFDCPQIIRCHRTFVVNLSHVIAMQGNSQSSLLKLKDINFEVPVSRSYIKVIKAELENLTVAVK